MNPSTMKLCGAIGLLLLAFPALGLCDIQGPDCKGVIHGNVIGHEGEPVIGIDVTLDPLGIGLSYMLPHMKTDQRGEYGFEHICNGRYSVFISDKDAGYPSSSSYMDQFLYGARISQVKISDSHLIQDLPINLPPKKPAQIQVRITNGKTKANIGEVEVQLTVNRKRRLSYQCHEFSPCDRKPFLLLPPDQDVLIRVTANGFHEWSNGGTRGKIIHAESGGLLTIDVVLDPND